MDNKNYRVTICFASWSVNLKYDPGDMKMTFPFTPEDAIEIGKELQNAGQYMIDQTKEKDERNVVE